VDALSTIMLLLAIETMYPAMRLIHVFLDNAKYHHAKLVQAWLARSGCRIRLHFIPAYCPHLNPIERLWGLMHRHTTHNRCYGTFNDFSTAMLTFLRHDVPKNWRSWCDEVTDNFRVIDPKDFVCKVGGERRIASQRPVSHRLFPNRTCDFRFASGSPEDMAKSGVPIQARRYRQTGVIESKNCSVDPSRQTLRVRRS